jgi:uncharacterized protein YodC (DUF2158 family)
MANKFNHGDIVVLKSGGPPMTVEHVPGERHSFGIFSEYHCRWFRGASQESGQFPEHLLDKFEPPKKA